MMDTSCLNICSRSEAGEDLWVSESEPLPLHSSISMILIATSWDKYVPLYNPPVDPFPSFSPNSSCAVQKVHIQLTTHPIKSYIQGLQDVTRAGGSQLVLPFPEHQSIQSIHHIDRIYKHTRLKSTAQSSYWMASAASRNLEPSERLPLASDFSSRAVKTARLSSSACKTTQTQKLRTQKELKNFPLLTHKHQVKYNSSDSS